ncbi:hypothetical protein [Pedobacter ginsengisoli]|uniref:hypothetical protein n=1 Tax=Pedobacter ginsengisoli TaxID=363852 RepID=UPI00254E6B1C|nr:hypothetical protein [Pedobacter ginsengisoli]
MREFLGIPKRAKNAKVSVQTKENIYHDYTVMCKAGKPKTRSKKWIAGKYDVSVSTVEHCIRIGKSKEGGNS